MYTVINANPTTIENATVQTLAPVTAPVVSAPKAEKVGKLLVADKDLDDGILTIVIDTKLDIAALEGVVPSDKGNRTILYEKWTDAGITYQLTGYVTATNYSDRQSVAATARVKAIEKQNAEFLSMMNNDPEFKALYEAKRAAQGK